MKRDRIFHWVRLHELADWLACGWYVTRPSTMMHHHEYGFFCEWLCDCRMTKPQ